MKPECAHIRERFSEHLDGRLAPSERQEVDAHLAGCPECRRELELWRSTMGAVAELPRRGAPEGFGARVMERLGGAGERAPVRPRLWVLWARALPVAAMFLVAFGVLFSVQRNGRLRRPEAPARLPAASAPAREALTYGGGAGAAGRAPISAGVPVVSAAKPVPQLAEEARRAGGEREQVTGLQASRTAQTEARGEVELGTTLHMKARAMMGAHGPRGGEVELVFQQMALPVKAAEPPQQVLTLRAADTAELTRRTVAVANAQGLTVGLALKPGDQTDISVQVPADRYDALLASLADLTAPQSQALSNTAVGQGTFFRTAMDNYNARNYIRLTSQQQQLAEKLTVADRLKGLNRQQPALQGAAAPSAMAANAPAAAASDEGMAMDMATPSAEAHARQEAEMKDGTLKGETAGAPQTPHLVNLQISIVPTQPAPARPQ